MLERSDQSKQVELQRMEWQSLKRRSLCWGAETGAVSDIFWIREIAGPARYQLVDETYQFQIKNIVPAEIQRLVTMSW